MNDLKTITPPADDLLSLSDVKTRLKIEHTDEDSLISDLISEARELLERYCAISIGEQVKEWVVDICATDEPYFPYGPVIEVSKAGYLEWDTWEEQTVNNDYTVKGNAFKQFLPFITGTWKLTYTAGYTDLPAGLKSAWYDLIGHLYENRGDSELPSNVKAKLNPYLQKFGV